MTYILHLVWSRVASTWGAAAEPVCNLLVAVSAAIALLNPSKKIIVDICMVAGLALSNAAIAEDARLGEFQSKIEKMAEILTSF